MKVSLLAFVALLALSTPAFADGSRAAAEALFREGRDAARAGDYKTACDKFEESNRLEPAPGTRLNIADCSERIGRIATAWTYYTQVAEQLPPSDERRELASQKAASLAPRLPRLTVRLAPDSPPNTQVTRDGVELGAASLGTALPVDPGHSVIEVRAPGFQPKRYEVDLAEGEQKVETVAPGPRLTSPRTPEGPDVSVSTADSGSSQRTLGYVLGGVGVVGLAVGGVTGMMTLSKKSEVDDNCDANKRCNQTGIDAADSGKTLGTVSGVSLGVGAAALAVGAYLVLSADDSGRPERGLAFDGRSVRFVGVF